MLDKIICLEFDYTGGLFDEPTDDVELAFKYAINGVNELNNNLTNFEALTMRVEYGNQFETSKKLCAMLKVRDEVVWILFLKMNLMLVLHAR